MKRIAVFILLNLALTVLVAGAASYFGDLRFVGPKEAGVRFECYMHNARLVILRSGSGCEQIAPEGYQLKASSIGIVLFEYLARDAKRPWVYRYWDKDSWAFSVHAICPFSLFAAYPTWVMIGALRRRRTTRENECHKCRYDLTGNVSGVCSECGAPVQSASDYG